MQEQSLSAEIIPQLSAKERARIRLRHALHRRYEAAVTLYAETEKPIRTIAEECGESESALRAYLRRYWRELMLRRHGIEAEGKEAQEFSFYTPEGQSCLAHKKYKDAVVACDSIQYIDLNVSQVARKFGVDGTALANFIRVHYPDILIRREQFRQKLGINDNIHRGVRKVCKEQYAEAVELYRTTDMSVKAVAAKYAEAIESLRQHPRPVSYVAREFGHHPEVFRGYLRKHEPELAAKLGLKPAIRKK